MEIVNGRGRLRTLVCSAMIFTSLLSRGVVSRCAGRPRKWPLLTGMSKFAASIAAMVLMPPWKMGGGDLNPRDGQRVGCKEHERPQHCLSTVQAYRVKTIPSRVGGPVPVALL